ncbi:MAG: hypothetical protein M3475_03815, partial [Actinomycetota bacterium]|nr:hypothetical protein [Actinomycetota bacterium]
MILISAGSSRSVLKISEISEQISAAGHSVEVLLEPDTERFIGRAAFADSVSVVTEPTQKPAAILFAPATSATLARLAHGLSSGPAGELYASGLQPVFIAPDLDEETANHPAVLENLELLREAGCKVIGTDTGFPTAM